MKANLVIRKNYDDKETQSSMKNSSNVLVQHVFLLSVIELEEKIKNGDGKCTCRIKQLKPKAFYGILDWKIGMINCFFWLGFKHFSPGYPENHYILWIQN